jgi:GNAT superfamily N-acetyltransferase
VPQHLADLAADPRTCLLVAEQAGAVVGSVLINLCADVMYRGQPFAVLENIIVSAAVRGRGVGVALLAVAERHCRDADCSKIMLSSSASRVDAHRFFSRAGFNGDAKRGFVKYRRHFGE